MTKQKVYKFKNIPELYADLSGNFFFNQTPVPKVYNNGSSAVRIGKTKYGIKKLRTLAFVSYVIIDDLPF
jgi:hypothetical protein